jgi:transcription initiation factor TFIIIB Brf1 subunit/transcription initiation factor TFIIB
MMFEVASNEEEFDRILMDLNLNKPVNSSISECITCNSDNIIIDIVHSNFVCKECGSIMEFHENKLEISNQTSLNNTFYQSFTNATVMSGKSKLSFAYNTSQYQYKDKILLEIHNRIQEKCKSIGITQNIIDSAKILYRNVTLFKVPSGRTIILKNKNKLSIMAACVYHACKKEQEPRIPKEIANIFGIECKDITKGYKKLLLLIDYESGYINPIINYGQYALKYAKQLNIPEVYYDELKEYCVNIQKINIASTHEPRTIEIGCVYLIVMKYGLNISKNIIAKEADISTNTLMMIYKHISEYTKLDFSQISIPLATNNETAKKFVDVFNISEDYLDEIIKVCNNVKRLGILSAYSKETIEIICVYYIISKNRIDIKKDVFIKTTKIQPSVFKNAYNRLINYRCVITDAVTNIFYKKIVESI